MKKSSSYRVVLLLILILLLVGCKKYEMDSNRFAKQGSWEFSELLIDDNNVSALPRWHVEKPVKAGEFATGIWMHHNGSSAQFLWRFENYSRSFEFELVKEEGDDSVSKACLQCANLAGKYTILSNKKKLYEFQSIQTNGYGELPVFIQLKPY